jgi:hypothetical protein
MDVFSCPVCKVTPELVVDGNAQLAIVRHKLGCATLMAQTRTRWPAAAGRCARCDTTIVPQGFPANRGHVACLGHGGGHTT